MANPITAQIDLDFLERARSEPDSPQDGFIVRLKRIGSAALITLSLVCMGAGYVASKAWDTMNPDSQSVEFLERNALHAADPAIRLKARKELWQKARDAQSIAYDSSLTEDELRKQNNAITNSILHLIPLLKDLRKSDRDLLFLELKNSNR